MSVEFTEKYRPSKLSECVLPNRIKSKLEKLIKRKDLGHLIFYGSAGIGKTATAQALIKELAPDDNTIINASQDNSVDYIKNKVVTGMATVSLYGSKRIILLDEADGLTENAQKLLRVPMETMSGHIILIKNHKEDTIGTLTNVNDYELVKKKMPNFERSRVTNKVKEYFKKTTTIVKDMIAEMKKMEKIINGNDYDFFCTSYSGRDINWSERKDLFLEPSIVTKKYHYEIGNHLDYKPHLEYKVVDKELVNKQVNEFIIKMSNSKKSYELKRAQKKGLSLEDHILEQKFKLVS